VNFTERVLLEFAYVSNRIPEISDELYKIDDAMKAFGWENGPFEIWDAIVRKVAIMKEGLEPAV
jgi:3-hydroxyacyl-CoA dehydrogenase